MMNCVVVYSIIAWRIMYLCHLGRECPDLDCEVVFEPCEWKSAYMALKRTEPPATPLRLNEVIRMIASLGGYVDRKLTFVLEIPCALPNNVSPTRNRGNSHSPTLF
jgi:hypothetical protein